MSKTKTRLVADFLGRVQANPDTGVAEQGDLTTLLGAAPEALDTINELAAAIGEDASFAITVTDSIATKVAKAGDTITGDLAFTDGTKATFGAAADLQIYHNSTVGHSYIVESGTGDLRVYADGQIRLGSWQTGDLYFDGNAAGAANLYYAGGKKLATTSTGVDVTGNLDVSNGIFVGAGDHYLYSIDSKTLGFRVGPNPYDYLRFGEETDGGGSLSTGAGDLKLKRGADTKLQLTTTGVTVTGDVTADTFYGSGASLTGITVGGSLTGGIEDVRVQYGTSYNGTPGQGSFFFDSLNQKLMVHTGAGFVDAVPAGSGDTSGGTATDANTTFRKYTYTLASATNAISGADENGKTLSYVTDGTQNIEVYVNGIKQLEGATNDYVATTGTSVTFTYNLPATSSVDIQVYELLTNDAYYVKNDVYTKTETNTQISTGLASYLPLVGGSIGGLTIRNTDWQNALKINRDLDVATVGAAGIQMRYGAKYNGADVYPVVTTGVVDTDGTALRFDVDLDGTNYLRVNYNEFIVNDSGQDYDFRVESDLSTHALFVDAGANKVGIFDSSPGTQLTVAGDVSIRPASGGDYYGTLRWYRGNTGTGTFAKIGFRDPTLANDTFLLDSSGNGNPMGFVTNADPFYFWVNGTGTGTADVRIESTGGMVINENGNNSDFRVESSVNEHALFVDSPSGNVGINNSAPAESLDVVGNIAVSGTVDGVDIASLNGSVPKRLYEQYWSHTYTSGYVTLSYPYYAGSGSSFYHVYDVFAQEDIGVMNSQIEYRVFVHIRTAGDANYNSYNIQVVKKGHSSKELEFYVERVAGVGTKLHIYGAEDYTTISVMGYPFKQTIGSDSSATFSTTYNSAPSGVLLPVSSPWALDDYEEGTWIPVLKTGGGTNLMSYSGTCEALYTKIGRQVTVHMNLEAATTSGVLEQRFKIEGLPYAANPQGRYVSTPMLYYASGLGFTNDDIVGTISGGTSYIEVYENDGSYYHPTVSRVGSGTYLYFSITYFTA